MIVHPLHYSEVKTGIELVGKMSANIKLNECQYKTYVHISLFFH